MNSESLKYSIIVPVYNSEKYLKSCIESVLAQDYSNYELILVDDGSTDSSGAICDQYASESTKIRAFHVENGGPLAARVFGIEQSGGDYLLFLDSDDYFTDNAIKTLNETILEENCDCVVFGLQRVSNGVVKSQLKNSSKESFEGQKNIIKKIGFSNRYGSMCIKCIKKSFASQEVLSQYKHLTMGEDYLQSLIILKDCNKVTFIPDVLYNYTTNPTSLSQQANRYQLDPFFYVRSEALKLFKSLNIFDESEYDLFFESILGTIVEKVTDFTLSKITSKEKKELYNSIHNNSFYNEHLKKAKIPKGSSKIKSLIYYMFKIKLYFPLYIIGKLGER